MFNVKIDKYNIAFTFSHLRGIGEANGISDVSTCTIKVNGESFTGVAACSMKDMFSKERGRKVSLARALKAVREKIELPREVREAVWCRYFGRWCPNAEWIGVICVGTDTEYEYSGTLDPEFQGKAKAEV